MIKTGTGTWKKRISLRVRQGIFVAQFLYPPLYSVQRKLCLTFTYGYNIDNMAQMIRNSYNIFEMIRKTLE